MRNLKWQWQVFSLSVRQVVTYRIEFWFNMLMYAFGNLAVAFYLWKAIFQASEVQTINGMGIKHITFYYIIAPMLFRSVMGPSTFHISREIYQGELNKYLVYPLDYFQYRFASNLAYTVFYFLQMLGCLGIYVYFLGTPPGVELTFTNISLAFIYVIIASYLYFCIAACLMLVAFWADQTWSLMVLLRFVISLFGGVFIPLTLMPQSFQEIVHWMPFQTMVSSPTKIMQGQMAIIEMLELSTILGIWILIFYFLRQWIWRRGCLTYSGIGM